MATNKQSEVKTGMKQSHGSFPFDKSKRCMSIKQFINFLWKPIELFYSSIYIYLVTLGYLIVLRRNRENLLIGQLSLNISLRLFLPRNYFGRILKTCNLKQFELPRYADLIWNITDTTFNYMDRISTSVEVYFDQLYKTLFLSKVI